MKANYKLICLILLISGTSSLKNTIQAQDGTKLYSISGSVADSADKKPLDFVTVGLKNEAKQVLKTGISKNDGSFSFEKLPSGRYYISLISVGYTTKAIRVDLDDTKDLGIIFMSSGNYKLSEVTVTASQPVVRQETDRIIYDLKADPESKVSTVLEMMRKVPLLSVDGDDNLLMNGNRSYKILINGRPSGMIERNARDILRSMPASAIKNIEVIFSPSSKYDAEGVAGIINIITDKKIDNGYNGSLNVREDLPSGGPATGGSFTFRQGKFGASLMGGASQYISPSAKTFNNRITGGADASSLAQNSSRESDNRSAYSGAEISFEIDSLNLISGQFNMSANKLAGTGKQASSLSNESGILQAYLLDNRLLEKGSGGDAGINYQMGFKSDKARLLTFSYRYLASENKQMNRLNISEPVNYLTPGYVQENEGSSREQTVQVDYVHPIKKVSIEAGLKGIFRKNSSNYEYRAYDPSADMFQVVPAWSNTFNNTQDVYSAYNTYQLNLKSWGFKAGARVEQTVIDAGFTSAAANVRQNYLNVVPAFAISRKFKDMGSLSLSYVIRMQRPGIAQLNPFVDRSDPDMEISGNPALRPAFTNVIQLGYNRTKKVTLSLAAAYMFFNDLIGPVSVYDPLAKITRTSYENLSQGHVLRSNIYINYPLNSKINLSFNTDIRYAQLTTTANGKPVDISGPMAYLNISAGYRFEKGLRLNANLTSNSSNISGPQTRLNGYTSTSFSMNKEIVKDQLTFAAIIRNPFNKYRSNEETKSGPGFTQVSDSRIFYRGFAAGLNYRFGKLKSGLKKTRKGIVNDDLIENK